MQQKPPQPKFMEKNIRTFQAGFTVTQQKTAASTTNQCPPNQDQTQVKICQDPEWQTPIPAHTSSLNASSTASQNHNDTQNQPETSLMS